MRSAQQEIKKDSDDIDYETGGAVVPAWHIAIAVLDGSGRVLGRVDVTLGHTPVQATLSES